MNKEERSKRTHEALTCVQEHISNADNIVNHAYRSPTKIQGILWDMSTGCR